MKVDGSNYQNKTDYVKQEQPATLQSFLLSKRDEFIKVLPPGTISADRFIESAVLEFNKNPQLISCSRESIGRVLNTVAVYGLELGSTMGEAFLIPYKGTATFQIGYKGLMKLSRRSGEIKAIKIETVYEADEFDVEFGTKPHILHLPDIWNPKRGKVLGWYCIVELTTGGEHIGHLSVSEAEQHRDKYSKAHNHSRNNQGELSVWDLNFEAMAIKTMLIKTLKYCPLNVESTKAIHNAEMVMVGKHDSEEVISGECA